MTNQCSKLAAGTAGMKRPGHSCMFRQCLCFTCHVWNLALNYWTDDYLSLTVWQWSDKKMQNAQALVCHDVLLWICHHRESGSRCCYHALKREREEEGERVGLEVGNLNIPAWLWKGGHLIPKTPVSSLWFVRNGTVIPRGVRKHLLHGDKRGAREEEREREERDGGGHTGQNIHTVLHKMRNNKITSQTLMCWIDLFFFLGYSL